MNRLIPNPQNNAKVYNYDTSTSIEHCLITSPRHTTLRQGYAQLHYRSVTQCSLEAAQCGIAKYGGGTLNPA